MPADIPSSLSPRDFVELFNLYARQVTAGNWAAFAAEKLTVSSHIK
jgi:hypothetical protein